MTLFSVLNNLFKGSIFCAAFLLINTVFAQNTLTEFVEDKIGNKIIAGSGIIKNYNDTTGETTLSTTGGGGGGEANTASNLGTAGVGLFINKLGIDLRFKKINSGSNKVTIVDDIANNELDIDVVPSNFTGIPQSGITNLLTDLSAKQQNIQFQDEGINLGTPGSVSNLNFTGTGVTVTYLLGTATVNIPSLGPLYYQLIRDEGINQNQRSNTNYLISSDINPVLIDDPINDETEISFYLEDSAVTRTKIENTDFWFQKKFEYYDDFITPWTTNISAQGRVYRSQLGAGATVGIVGSPTGPYVGEASATTGTTATGYAFLHSSAMILYFGYGEWLFSTRVRYPTLSTSSQRYGSIVGFYSTQTGLSQSNGVYFLYDSAGVHPGVTGSPNWQCITTNNSVRTITNTGVLVTTAYQKMEIIVNAAGTEAKFYINGTLVATHTSNIVVTAPRSVGFGSGIIKSAGTTAVIMNLDYYYVRCNLTTDR